MEIKVVNIYPSQDMPNRGTAHIKLPTLGIQIKNILYFKKENSVTVLLPAKYNINEKQEKVYVPSISFTKKKTQKKFIQDLRAAIQDNL